ncbi:MAG TPA: hypothetical protein VJU87_05465 [Gemmatimonadaceae bacterium]|nr:hypothetical protein [Gemmatimonadaceae bacterium]
MRRLLVLACIGALAACHPSDILKVTDIDVARPESVSDSASLPALLDGAIGDFGVAYNGGGDFNQITLSGQLADELINTETFPTRIEVDERRQNFQNNGSLRDIFYATSQARASADRATAGFLKFAPTSAGLSESLNLSALTYIIFAENYCGAVPISSMDPATQEITYGVPLSTTQLLQVAVQKADSALTIATSANVAGSATYATQQARLARIVKARALLDMGQATEAAAAIGGTAGVPSNFQYTYTHSTTSGRQNNGTWGVTVSVGRFGVADKEGGNGLPFLTEGDTAQATKDPRVISGHRSNNKGNGFDGGTPQWVQLKYPARDSKVVIADGVEARLIEAEAQLKAGDYPGMLATLNALRSDPSVLAVRGYAAGSLPPLPDVSAQGLTAEQNQLFSERAYWLYLTSHRLGDLRRLIRDYQRPAETVFPTGAYVKYGVTSTYGTDVNSPIPQAEENNPNFKRSSCSTTTA